MIAATSGSTASTRRAGLQVDVVGVVDRRLLQQVGDVAVEAAAASPVTVNGDPFGAGTGAVDLVGAAVQLDREGVVEPGGQVLPLAADPLVGEQLDLGDTGGVLVDHVEGDRTGRRPCSGSRRSRSPR